MVVIRVKCWWSQKRLFVFAGKVVNCCFCYSVAKSCLTLVPRGLQHTRLPCPKTVSQGWPKLMFIELVMPSNHLILCHPLLLLPSVFPSIRVFSKGSPLHIRWPKCIGRLFVSQQLIIKKVTKKKSCRLSTNFVWSRI